MTELLKIVQVWTVGWISKLWLEVVHLADSLVTTFEIRVDKDTFLYSKLAMVFAHPGSASQTFNIVILDSC